jgi:hypothetical protein
MATDIKFSFLDGDGEPWEIAHAPGSGYVHITANGYGPITPQRTGDSVCWGIPVEDAAAFGRILAEIGTLATARFEEEIGK